MSALSPLVFGPNAGGWRISIRPEDEAGDWSNFRVELTGPSLKFESYTCDGRNNLADFVTSLRKLVADLAGHATLKTDYFTLDVSVRPKGHLVFEGRLVSYQFDQYPTGSITVSFEQVFDPITIEQTLRDA